MTDIPIATAARDLRAALPRALIVAAAITLAALRLFGVWLAVQGFGDPSYRVVLLPLNYFAAGLAYGVAAKTRGPSLGLYLIGVALLVIEAACLSAGGL